MQESECLYRLKDSALRAGDIIFTKDRRGLTSNVTVAATRGKFSHVALHIGRGMVIEATKKRGVEIGDACRIFFTDPSCLAVARPVELDSHPTACEQLGKLAARIGPAPYDKKGAFLAWFSDSLASRFSDSDLICSELIALVFEALGIPLLEQHHASILPRDLEHSQKLRWLQQSDYLSKHPKQAVVNFLGRYPTEHSEPYPSPFKASVRSIVSLLKAGKITVDQAMVIKLQNEIKWFQEHWSSLDQTAHAWSSMIAEWDCDTIEFALETIAQTERLYTQYLYTQETFEMIADTSTRETLINLENQKREIMKSIVPLYRHRLSSLKKTLRRHSKGQGHVS